MSCRFSHPVLLFFFVKGDCDRLAVHVLTHSFPTRCASDLLSASRAAPGAGTQPELGTPGIGGCWGPSFGLGSQQLSNNTNSGLIWCFAAMSRKTFIRVLRPSASSSHSRLCR